MRVYYGLDFFPLASWASEISGTTADNPKEDDGNKKKTADNPKEDDGNEKTKDEQKKEDLDPVKEIEKNICVKGALTENSFQDPLAEDTDDPNYSSVSFLV